MASSVSTGNISDEQRRWVVVGICLTKVLTPALRNVLSAELQSWYNLLCQPPVEIHKQSPSKHKKTLASSKLKLKYENINNNHVHKSPRAYDYGVKDDLSLAKLFVQPFMTHFTGFDQTMDVSAVLTVMSEAHPFVTSGAAAHAKKVRSDVRNEWAHCNFFKWTIFKFDAAFQEMKLLVKKMNLSPANKMALCDELDGWKDKGLELCFGRAVDPELLKLVSEEVAELLRSVKTWKLKSEIEMNGIIQQLGNMQSNFGKELTQLQERISKCEKRGAENTQQLEVLNKRFCTELSRYHYKPEEKIPYVFDAPDRNQYFSGRTRELDELQGILKLDSTEQQNKVSIAAVCGLGGIGKTSLVAEYAHMMKKDYKGGVYWFSAESNDFFKRSVEKTACKLGTLSMDFDETLTSTLMTFSHLQESLVVLDSLDQLDLSPQVLNFISDISKLNVALAVVILTRRKENLLVEEISGLPKSRCLTLKCLDVEEAKHFLFNRTGIAKDENTNSVAKNLVEELGGLPLALEQAGACIKALHCNLSEYLEEYKIKRLELLNSQKAKPASLSQSPERLAVHTTWSLNISHIKENPKGISAIRLMNAYAFLNPAEIEEELVNVGEPPIEDEAFRDCVNSRIGCIQLINLLTNFSLFTHVDAHSVGTHRLVQEIVRESLDPDEKAQSFVDAVRLLSFAFSRCSSPRSLFSRVGDEERIETFDIPRNASSYYLWSKLCSHVFYLHQKLEKFLENPDLQCLDLLFSLEIAKIFHECVINLSANQKQKEAKRLLNLAYRVLDWVPLSNYDALEKIVSNNSLSPFLIPLPKKFQITIKQCCKPKISSVEPLDEKPKALDDLHNLQQNVEKLKLQGNKNFKDGLYKEAVDAYSAAIDMSKGTPAFNPLLLTNRASANIKLNQKDAALKDANEYIVRFPACWKGYARKALASDEKVSAEIAAALAYYYFHQNDGKCIFAEYEPFKTAFQGLKRRICVSNTVNELDEALSLDNTRTYLRFIILGSDEYNLNANMFSSSRVAKKERDFTSLHISDVIMVGTKSDGSVKIKFNGKINLYLFEKCMLVNLCFCFDLGQLRTLRDSWVKALNCSFSCKNEYCPAVAASGMFNAEQCNFTNCNAGGLLCEGPSDMIVDGCTFASNKLAGLEVRENGRLTVRNSHMYNCLDGLAIGPRAAECNAFNCKMYYNARSGILAIDGSKRTTLMRNEVFGNNEDGIFVRESDVDMRENKFFNNESWGIWSQTNSWCNISINEIFSNKSGGVRVGKRPARKEFRPSVVELNKIHDNYGPGYVDNINDFEDPRIDRIDDLSKMGADYQPAKFEQNLIYNNEERIIVNQCKLSSCWCSACYGKNEKLKPCGKCFTASYCNVECQKRHWSKHKNLCKLLREKSSFLITSMKWRGFQGNVNVHAKGLDEIGPKFCSHPPRDGKTRFIVKLQTDFDRETLGKPHMLVIYDRSFDVNETFQAEFIDRLVKEFGVSCQRKYQEKKLFLHCVFENGKLRLFINDFAPFQTW